MLIHHGPNLDHRINQLFRREQISDAQGRIENLAHRARVDHAAGIIESLQTRKWGAGETKFRVVIVLENVGVTLARKIDQRSPARKAHGHAERKLMRWRYVNDLGRRPFRSLRDHDSLAINGSWHDRGSGKKKSAASLVKSRIFDPRDLPPIYQGQRAD